MKIAVWKTGHEIADTVAEAVSHGLLGCGHQVVFCTPEHLELASCYDINIGYGIMRGMDAVFRESEHAGKPWFNIDKGYWKPGHYDGYYRISLRGTQQTIGLDKLNPDYARWDVLDIDILPRKIGGTHTLCCPMTPHVKGFFRDIDPYCYTSLPLPEINEPAILRTKDSQHPLESHLHYANKIVTFNSSVGWEALRQGIPVISDPTHSIVGTYQKLVDKPLNVDSNERRKLFAIMASLQLTLSEMRSGQLWPLLQTLLSISDMTDAKPLQAMSLRTLYANGQ